MVKTLEKEKEVYVSRPSYEKKSCKVYECSDGTEYTDENDYRGYKTGLQLAEEHEEYLVKQNIAKKELKFHSMNSDKKYNNEYEPEFYFYYNPNLSKETKNVLIRLVYEIKYSSDLDKMVEGWYFVKQHVNEIDSSSRCWYECEGNFELLSAFIEEKEEDINYYKKMFEELKTK